MKKYTERMSELNYDSMSIQHTIDQKRPMRRSERQPFFQEASRASFNFKVNPKTLQSAKLLLRYPIFYGNYWFDEGNHKIQKTNLAIFVERHYKISEAFHLALGDSKYFGGVSCVYNVI